MCPTCHGRGEVSAGITGGIVEYGPAYTAYDWRGNQYAARCAFPTQVYPNPKALIENKLTKKMEIWFLESNPLCELWGVAICGNCRGSGFSA